MRKVFFTGLGSLLLSGLLVTQSWAGSFKSDLACVAPYEGGKVSIAPNGTVKGSLRLSQPLTTPVQLSCALYCVDMLSAGPAVCVDGNTGDTTLKIKAPGLGAALSGICNNPTVTIVGSCNSAYIPPGP